MKITSLCTRKKTKKENTGKTIALIRGHTSRDGGAVAYEGTSEYNFYQKVVPLAENLLRRAGFTVRLYDHNPSIGSYTGRMKDTAARIDKNSGADISIEPFFGDNPEDARFWIENPSKMAELISEAILNFEW